VAKVGNISSFVLLDILIAVGYAEGEKDLAELVKAPVKTSL